MDAKHALKVEYRPVNSLFPYPRNARVHSRRQITQLIKSIEEFGFTNPILIDSENGIIAGHGRALAAKRLGMETVPTIRLAQLSEAQIRAYVLADNKLALNAGWDDELLAVELGYLAHLDIDMDVEITGFSMAEIDLIIENASEDTEEEGPVPNVPLLEHTVSRTGDHWHLGSHRLLCGDARSVADVARLMAGTKAQMVFVDPPYNVAIGGVCGRGDIKHPDFAMASGELSSDDYVRFLCDAFSQLVKHSRNGALHYIFSGWQHLYEVLTAARGVYTEQKGLCFWNKTNGGMGGLYRSKHEVVVVCKSGKRAHINNIELGRHGRNRSNVWDYPGVNTFREGRLEDLAVHPTVKPVALVADAILDASRRRGIVLDTFVGSGTTMLAADRVGRRGYGLEIDPRYVDVALRRWMKLTGEVAIHSETGMTFDAVAEARGVPLQNVAEAPDD